MRRTQTTALLCGALLLAVGANADDITVSGNPYKDVLVSKTGNFYYVQLPEEGRTISVLIAQVDASTVKINDDPFYRGPLKEKYTVNKTRRAAGEIKDVAPAFRTSGAAGNGSSLSLDDLRGSGAGGGGGGGFGVPRTTIETTLTQFGFQFQPGPGNTSAIAKRPDGSLELLGPPESLTGILAKASGPVAAVDATAQQLQLLLMQLKAEAATAYMGALNEAKQKGSASVSAAGVSISITRTVNGENADMEIRLTAGG